MVLKLVRLSDEQAGRIQRAPKEVYGVLRSPLLAATDLDKTWHVVHFLLTGSAEDGEGPLSFLLAGGRPVGEVDLGFGPGRLFVREELQEIAQALGRISESDLPSRYRPERMGDLYGWAPGRDEDELFIATHYFNVLKDFVGASVGSALLVVLS